MKKTVASITIIGMLGMASWSVASPLSGHLLGKPVCLVRHHHRIVPCCHRDKHRRLRCTKPTFTG